MIELEQLPKRRSLGRKLDFEEVGNLEKLRQRFGRPKDEKTNSKCPKSK